MLYDNQQQMYMYILSSTVCMYTDDLNMYVHISHCVDTIVQQVWSKQYVDSPKKATMTSPTIKIRNNRQHIMSVQDLERNRKFF